MLGLGCTVGRALGEVVAGREGAAGRAVGRLGADGCALGRLRVDGCAVGRLGAEGCTRGRVGEDGWPLGRLDVGGLDRGDAAGRPPEPAPLRVVGVVLDGVALGAEGLVGRTIRVSPRLGVAGAVVRSEGGGVRTGSLELGVGRRCSVGRGVDWLVSGVTLRGVAVGVPAAGDSLKSATVRGGAGRVRTRGR